MKNLKIAFLMLSGFLTTSFYTTDDAGSNPNNPIILLDIAFLKKCKASISSAMSIDQYQDFYLSAKKQERLGSTAKNPFLWLGALKGRYESYKFLNKETFVVFPISKKHGICVVMKNGKILYFHAFVSWCENYAGEKTYMYDLPFKPKKNNFFFSELKSESTACNGLILYRGFDKDDSSYCSEEWTGCEVVVTIDFRNPIDGQFYRFFGDIKEFLQVQSKTNPDNKFYIRKCDWYPLTQPPAVRKIKKPTVFKQRPVEPSDLNNPGTWNIGIPFK